MLDLSNPIRLAGFPPNAKLELVKLSKSASVVSVALQLPESEAQGVPNGRLTDKFPSDTSLWQILRKFESGSSGGLGTQKNFTARGVPVTAEGDNGAGRLYYETPVIQYLGREVSSFVDLQKSLGKLGFNGGSILLRLSFRATQDPLEEAMQNIGAYFKSVEQGANSQGAHAGSAATMESKPDVSQPALAEADTESKSPPEPLSPAPTAPATEPTTPYENDASSSAPTPNGEQPEKEASEIHEQPFSSGPTMTGPNQRPISVYAPSSSTTPRAAQQAYNENDYVPTIAHAKLHQSRLQGSTHNQRLASYADDERQQKAEAQKLTEVKELKTRIRFPDQTMVDAQFSNLDTAAVLYECIRSLLKHEDAPFLLKYSSPKGPKEVPKENMQRLIADLGMVGPLLINFIWEEGASPEARRAPVLKPEYAKNAKEIQVQEIQGQDEEEDTSALRKPQSNARPSGGDRKGMPAWMKKTLGKK